MFNFIKARLVSQAAFKEFRCFSAVGILANWETSMGGSTNMKNGKAKRSRIEEGWIKFNVVDLLQANWELQD